MVVEILYPTPELVQQLVDNMRAADVEEVLASGPMSPLAAVEFSVERSTHAAAMVVDNQLVCIFGVAPLSVASGLGAPWMLGTDLVAVHAKRFSRVARPYIEAMNRAYPKLVNFVHDKNTVSLAWLQRCGFVLTGKTLTGPTGETFLEFARGE